MNEIWKSVVGYEGLYEVSSLGNVRSLNYNHTGKPQILIPVLNGKGYLQVCLHKYGKQNMFRVHRLVAQAFLENPQNLPQVNHKNEIKNDNRVENLEWCSSEYNINYGTRNQRMAEAHINHPDMSVRINCYSKSGEFICQYPSINEAYRQTGIHIGNICLCCQGNRQSAGGYVWRYA